MPYRTPSKRYGVIAFAAVVAIVISFLFAAKGTVDRRTALAAQNAAQRAAQLEADHEACLRINKIYIIIQRQLRLSLQTTPKLAYYQKHRVELHSFIHATQDEIKAFAPAKC